MNAGTIENTRPAGHPLREERDFSLILGGPLFQMFLRSHLSGGHLELIRRRIVFLAGLAWLPLAALSVADGRAWGSAVRVPFLFDIETHVRFLVALPLLVVAEMVVHERMRPLLRNFVGRGLIGEGAHARFEAAVDSAVRLRNSVLAEVVILALVWGVGTLVIWRQYAAIEVAGWYGTPGPEGLQPSLAGWWLGWVSLPIFQFLLLRWYFRLIVWARFLWQVSRIELDLVPTHPDGAAGLGFLAQVSHAFTPLLMAQGAILSGWIANRIVFAGAKLPQFKIELVAIVAAMLFFVLGPLLVFCPQLARVRRRGLADYGGLAQRYVREFDRKWLHGGAPPGEPLVGSADIQSLADLSNSFQIIRDMRSVVFTRRSVVQLAIATLLPIAPLALSMISVSELIDRAVRVAF